MPDLREVSKSRMSVSKTIAASIQSNIPDMSPSLPTDESSNAQPEAAMVSPLRARIIALENRMSCLRCRAKILSMPLPAALGQRAPGEFVDAGMSDGATGKDEN